MAALLTKFFWSASGKLKPALGSVRVGLDDRDGCKTVVCGEANYESDRQLTPFALTRDNTHLSRPREVGRLSFVSVR